MLAWRYKHRKRRREDLLHLFSFGSGRWPFPKDSGHLGRRPPRLNPDWSISPGSIILEDSESVSRTFFGCSCMDYSFRLLFAFVSMCRSSTCQVFLRVFFPTAHVCTCTQHDDTCQQEEYQSTSRLENADEKKFQQEEQSVQLERRGTDTFSVLARSFCLIFDTHLSPRCQPEPW